MTRYTAGKRKLPEQLLEAGEVPADIGVDFAVGALQIGIGDHRRSAMSGTADEDGVKVSRTDHAVQVRVQEVQPGSGSPVPEQPRLDVLDLERLAQEWVVQQVDLAD